MYEYMRIVSSSVTTSYVIRYNQAIIFKKKISCKNLLIEINKFTCALLSRMFYIISQSESI